MIVEMVADENNPEGVTYNTHGNKLHFPPFEKAQFVTECGIV